MSGRAKRIFYALYRQGPLTKKELQATLNLKLTTLNREMRLLEEKNLLSGAGEAASTGGRKAATYALTPRLYLVGVDLSRTYVRIVLTDLKLQVRSMEAFALSAQDSAQKVLEKTCALTEKMLRESGISAGALLGIGIGSVGPLDRARGILLAPHGFPGTGWDHLSLKTYMEERFSVPCFVDNGANAAVLAEYLFGMGKNKQSVAYIHCGVGIRSAVIKDGRILRTMNDHEDAFGSMAVVLGQDRRSLEELSSLRAVASVLSGGTGPVGVWNEADYRKVLETVPADDEAVRGSLRERAGIFGVGLANFARLLNPDVIILSGPLMLHLELYYRACADAFYGDAPRTAALLSRGGAFQENGIALGAAALVVERLCETGVI